MISRNLLTSRSVLRCFFGRVQNARTLRTVARTLAVTSESDSSSPSQYGLVSLAALAMLSGGAVVTFTFCEKSAGNDSDDSNQTFTPSSVAKEDFEELQASHDIDSMPIFTLDELAENNGENGRPVWMSYGGVIYDVTDFIENHPGGSEKIMMAAGSAVEPFWYVYRQHFASDLPMRLMEHMAIGRLSDEDQQQIDEQMAVLEENDPYAKEPYRHKSLIVHSDTPMNAEVPGKLITQNYLTPTSLFYIRHHHPVPFLTEKEIKDFRLKVDLSASGKGIKSFSLEEIKAMEKVEVIATLQCSGNRRSGFNAFQRTSGTPWGQGAISTAKFGGVRLRDLLKAAGLDDPIEAQEKAGLEHVRFHSIDGMKASIGIEKAVNPYGDCIVSYEMNDEPLPRDHGFPLRVIVPGYAAVRSVKWLDKIELAASEAEGPWQRGLNYKILPPNVNDAKNINLERMPSMTEASVFSGITSLERTTSEKLNPGDRVSMKVNGWAWSGGGRNIVRVDVTGDDGKSWAAADLKEGSNQRFGRAWAWTFWECDVSAVVHEDGNVRLASKAVDIAFNSQPEKSDYTWNVRGLGNNSWYRVQARVV